MTLVPCRKASFSLRTCLHIHASLPRLGNPDEVSAQSPPLLVPFHGNRHPQGFQQGHGKFAPCVNPFLPCLLVCSHTGTILSRCLELLHQVVTMFTRPLSQALCPHIGIGLEGDTHSPQPLFRLSGLAFKDRACQRAHFVHKCKPSSPSLFYFYFKNLFI